MPVVSKEKTRGEGRRSRDRGRQVEMDNSTVAGSIPHKLTDPSVTATNNKLHHTVMFQTISPLAILILNSRGNKRSDCDVQAMQDVNGHKSENGQNGQNGLATDQPHKILGKAEQLLGILSVEGSLCIEVRGQRRGDDISAKSLLIEKWIFQITHWNQSHNAHTTTMQYLTQAVRSFLHFSQITSWSVSYGGHLPFNLVYRLSSNISSHELFSEILPSPDTHKFPSVVLPNSLCVLEVTVHHLPRLDEVPTLLVSENELTSSTELPNGTSTAYDYSNVSSSQREIANGIYINASPIQFTRALMSLDSQRAQCQDSSSKLLFPFSPPTPSPLSPKFNNLSPSIKDGSLPESDTVTSKISSNSSSRTSSLKDRTTSSSQDMFTRRLISKKISSNDKDDRSAVRVQQAAIPFVYHWKNGVRPPGASSPIPHFAINGALTRDDTFDPKDFKRLKRRSCGVNMRVPSRPLPVRSMSLPAAVSNLCLLGTFEESVLNGRIDPYGYVEGFTAELGASGSFCPEHVTLPVTASFFNLSDDGGPSPYLGQIDLSNVGKRGYKVPKKGTIQLTLFNPNKTVVKIYIVTYDHADMPPNSSTFLRQKTVTRPSSATESIWPSLHYLIHLRFLCSKSHRVYLHTDIKLIFARKAPDTDPDMSKISLLTTTEGPIDPKYGPLTADYNP